MCIDFLKDGNNSQKSQLQVMGIKLKTQYQKRRQEGAK